MVKVAAGHLLLQPYQHKIAVYYGNGYEGVINTQKYSDWHYTAGFRK